MLYNSAALRGGESLLDSMSDTYNTACLYGGWNTDTQRLDDNQQNMIFATIEETYLKPAERKYNGDRELIDAYITYLKSMVPLLYHFDNALATGDKDQFDAARANVMAIAARDANDPNIQSLLLTSPKYRTPNNQLIGEPTFIYEETKKAILKKFNALRRLIMRGPRGTATFKNTSSARRMLKLMRRDLNVKQGNFMRGEMRNPAISYFGYAGRTTVPTAAWKSRHFPKNTILSREQFFARRERAKRAAEKRKLTPAQKAARKKAREDRWEQIRRDHGVGSRRAAYSALVAQDKAEALKTRLRGNYVDVARRDYDFRPLLGMEGISHGALLSALDAEDDAREARKEAYARYLESEDAMQDGDSHGAAEAAVGAAEAAVEAASSASSVSSPESSAEAEQAIEAAKAAIESAAAVAIPETEPDVREALKTVERAARIKEMREKVTAPIAGTRSQRRANRDAAMRLLPQNFTTMPRAERVAAARRALLEARAMNDHPAELYLQRMLRNE